MFDPKLQPPMPFKLKPARLTRGNHRLGIFYQGKSPNTTNSLLGIDYLMLKEK